MFDSTFLDDILLFDQEIPIKISQDPCLPHSQSQKTDPSSDQFGAMGMFPQVSSMRREFNSYVSTSSSSSNSEDGSPLLSSLDVSPTDVVMSSGQVDTSELSPSMSFADIATPLFDTTEPKDQLSPHLNSLVMEHQPSGSSVDPIEHGSSHASSESLPASVSVSKISKTGLSSPTNLPAIVIKDPSDPKSVRRARNTAAARRSRAKKNNRLMELEQVVEELRARNLDLMAENRVLKGLLVKK